MVKSSAKKNKSIVIESYARESLVTQRFVNHQRQEKKVVKFLKIKINNILQNADYGKVRNVT